MRRIHEMALGLAVAGLLAACGLPGPERGDGGASLPRSVALFPGNLDAGSTGSASTAGTISGEVTLLGAVTSAGVSVTLQPPMVATVTTDPAGSYLVQGVPPGSYTVTFSAPGYAAQSASAVLDASQDLALAQVQLTRSRLLLPLGVLPLDAGALLGYAPWRIGPDGGVVPGDQLFYGDGTSLFAADADAGASALLSTDGGYQFLGFDLQGGAVVTVQDGDGNTGATFADEGRLSVVALAHYPQDTTLADNTVFYAKGGGFGLTWTAQGRDDLAPIVVQRNVPFWPPVIVLGDALAGWTVTNGCDSPVVFGTHLSVSILGCFARLGPLTPSHDRARFAFVAHSQSADTPDVLVIVGQNVTPFTDGYLAQLSGPQIYPLTDTAYVAVDGDARGHLHLYVDVLDGGTWDTPIEEWAPLHGAHVLATTDGDAGTVLGLIGHGPTVPFTSPWSPPFSTADDRYVVFPGVPLIFDLQVGVEIPLVVTPASVAVDRAGAHLLLVDSAGQMATVDLARLRAGSTPQGQVLEGTALAASFTPDETAVVYVGTDPNQQAGLFTQPLPNP